MSPLPVSFLEHLKSAGYHPRSNKHSDALGTAIVESLLAACPMMRGRGLNGTLVFDLNFDLHVRTAMWNIDLVLGRPSGEPFPAGTNAIRREAPSTVEVAIEIKSVMTEHRKAVKNRKRDLEAHHEHVHNYNQKAIAGGVFVVNQALSFRSPLRPILTVHGRGDRQNVNALVAHCISEMRNVSERSRAGDEGLDAKCVLVVDMDNVTLGGTSYASRPPSPQIGDPLHYDAFLQRICDLYEERFGG